MIKINAIKLPDAFDIYKNTDGEKAEFLEPVSKINIFVGSNNSGKSRFMRLLSSQSEYEIKQDSLDLNATLSDLSSVIDNILGFMRTHKLTKIGTIDSAKFESLRLSIDNLFTIGGDRYKDFRTHFEELNRGFLRLETENGGHLISDGYGKIIHEKANELCRKVNKILEKLPIQSQSNSPKKVYLPTLRGLRPLDDAHTDFYLQRTVHDYFESPINDPKSNFKAEEARPEIFTGLSLYQRLTDLLLGNNSERRLINEYQNFISKSLFEDKSVALIPNQKEKVVIVKIGNEKEQPIHHLGDGIQSAIILSFLPFVMQEQTFFFIEEPEMYLHPGLQRKILNFYNSLNQHTFFLTTHSNHFLDITIDIKDVSIFTFRKIFDESDADELTPNFTVEAVDSGHESSLELLGVRNSSVFLVNATIWVEGITDRWYFRKMLNSYMDYLEETDELDLRLEEDTHYSFVEYGGANITHWSFLDYEEHPIEVERLCAKAVVIIDGDGEKKMKRKEDLERILSERLIILQCREVENLLPYKVIKEIVTEYENNPDLELKDYSYDKYQDEYLGTFIESTMLKSDVKRRGGYRENSGKAGTLKGKLDFCEKALPKIQYEDLPDAAKEIIAEIYRFICSRNK